MLNWFRWEWYWRVQRHWTWDAIKWRLAWLVPRSIALFVFVRVYACTGEGPGPDYARVYDAWTHGAGR